MILVYTWIVIELLVLIVVVWVAFGFFNTMFRGFPPLVASHKKAIDLILNTIKPEPHQVIYELGSGTARFLQMAEKKFSDVELVGLEYSMITFLLSKLFLWLKHSRIHLRRGDILKTNLVEADFIYCYLLPSMMPKIWQKMRAECRPGTMLISYQFPVADLEPKQKIEKGKEIIYFYEV